MTDRSGLVIQTNGDGGDCPCRCGVVIGESMALAQQHNKLNDPISTTQAFAIGSALVAATQKYLMPSPNVYWRYPIVYNQTNDFSRDQASRLMLGYGIAGRKDLVQGYYTLLYKNNFKHQNGDLIGTGEPGNIIRVLGWWALWPLLVIFDLKFFVDIISYKWQPWDIDNLFIMDLYYATKRYWTPTAWLASILYDKTAAALRVTNNLGDANDNNGCAEALAANLWFLKQL